MLWLLVLSTALAQQLPFPDPAIPEVNSQLYRPVMDSHRTLWADTTGQIVDFEATASLAMHYVNRPFVFVGDITEREKIIVSDALQVNAIAAFAFDRFRFGVDVPAYMFSAGQLTEDGAGIGDAAIDGRVTLLERGSSRLGLALGGRVTAPTSGVQAPLGSGGATGEVGALADLDATDDLLLTLNLATRVGPETDIGSTTYKDQLIYRAGAGYDLTDKSGLSAELTGQFNYAVPLSDGAGTPIEALLGGWYRLDPDWVLQGGFGRGLNRGIGAPNARVIAMIAYRRDTADIDGDGIADSVDQCPLQPEDFDGFEDKDGCPETDNDLDGIADVDDACPNIPEDHDQYDDEDGCPDPSRLVQIEVVNPNGWNIPNAASTITGRQTEVHGVGSHQVDLHDGPYQLVATADNYRDGQRDFIVSPEHDAVVTLQLEPMFGTIVVTVADELGEPVPRARWAIADRVGPSFEAGRASWEIEPGNHRLRVDADGFVSIVNTVEIVSGETTERNYTMRHPRVKLTKQRIDISDSIYFEFAKAIIKPESYSLLDEIALIINDHPELLLIRIEGHTDERGSDEYNQALSDARAAAVRTFLLDGGVAAERLHSVGYGESQPVDPGHNEKAWAKNRRVDFFIEKRSE